MHLKETYEQSLLHDSWESVYRDNPLQDRMNSCILDRVLKILKPSPEALFLDAGCGVGYHTLAIAGRGFRCVGIDISQTILRRAAENAGRLGLSKRASFCCQPLERLDFPGGSFDVVHCRGVLMHIPRWEKALAELCRVLKPGGKIVLLEANLRAIESRLVCLARRLVHPRSKLARTPGGLEFWSQHEGLPFVVRIADIDYLVQELKKNGLSLGKKMASEFWDIYRFPAGLWRNLSLRFNRLWFGLHLPSRWSMGNCLIGEKTGSKRSALSNQRSAKLFTISSYAHSAT